MAYKKEGIGIPIKIANQKNEGYLRVQPDLPVGTVTFLFSDIEGSTELWEQAPEAAGPALMRHDELIEAAVEQHHGVVVRP